MASRTRIRKAQPVKPLAKPRKGALVRWLAALAVLVSAVIALVLWVHSGLGRRGPVVAKASDPGFVLRPEAEVFATYAARLLPGLPSAGIRLVETVASRSGRACGRFEAGRPRVRSTERAFVQSQRLCRRNWLPYFQQDLTRPGQPARPSSASIGVDPLQQFLVTAPDGRLRASLRSPSRKSVKFDVYGLARSRWGHWTGRGMTWNTMCAACHNARATMTNPVIPTTPPWPR